MRIDMTSGNPLRRMLKFCAPMLMGSALMQLSNLLDSLIISRVAGVSAFTSIAAASPVMMLAMGFPMGFCAGFLIPIALAVGAGDQARADRVSCTALMLTALISVLVAIPSSALSGQLIRLVGTPDDLAMDAQRYLRIMLLGMPISMLSMTLTGLMRAEGDTRTPFGFQMLAMLLHTVLDVALVAGLRMGVAGAACAFLIAHATACAFCARHVLGKHPGILRYVRVGLRPDMVKSLISMGVPLGTTNLLASASASAFQFAVNSLGSTAVAAVAVADRLFSLPVMPAMLLGGVVEVFSGQNYGANRPDRIRIGAVRLYALMLGYLVPAMALTIAGSRFLIPLLVGDVAPQLIELARWYMLWCALAMPFQCACVILKNVLQGIGMPGKAVIASVYDLLVRLACALFGVAKFGFVAIGAANPIGWALASLALVVKYQAVSERDTPKIGAACEPLRAGHG